MYNICRTCNTMGVEGSRPHLRLLTYAQSYFSLMASGSSCPIMKMRTRRPAGGLSTYFQMLQDPLRNIPAV
jgi:hypothetical protein